MFYTKTESPFLSKLLRLILIHSSRFLFSKKMLTTLKNLVFSAYGKEEVLQTLRAHSLKDE